MRGFYRQDEIEELLPVQPISFWRILARLLLPPPRDNLSVGTSGLPKRLYGTIRYCRL
jgi:hypothetical protein